MWNSQAGFRARGMRHGELHGNSDQGLRVFEKSQPICIVSNQNLPDELTSSLIASFHLHVLSQVAVRSAIINCACDHISCEKFESWSVNHPLNRSQLSRASSGMIVSLCSSADCTF
jgi:hypothetical protein